MSSIGFRLKGERSRLGLNQADFSLIAGVTRKTQSLYEKDERNPDSAYLSAIAAAGADVNYILTGQRVVTSTLTREEEALLDNYRHSPVNQQTAIREVSAAFAQQHPISKAK